MGRIFLRCILVPIFSAILFKLNYIEMFGKGIRRTNDLYRESELKPILPVVNR